VPRRKGPQPPAEPSLQTLPPAAQTTRTRFAKRAGKQSDNHTLDVSDPDPRDSDVANPIVRIRHLAMSEAIVETVAVEACLARSQALTGERRRRRPVLLRMESGTLPQGAAWWAQRVAATRSHRDKEEVPGDATPGMTWQPRASPGRRAGRLLLTAAGRRPSTGNLAPAAG
jgi:hypothetical protein